MRGGKSTWENMYKDNVHTKVPYTLKDSFYFDLKSKPSYSS